MKKIMILTAVLAAAMTLSSCGGDNSGYASAGEMYAETTAVKKTISDATIVVGNWVGTYSGEVDDSGNPDGQGTWVSDYMSDFPNETVVVKGIWSSGGIYTGTLEWYYKNASMGKASVIEGEMNEDDFTAIDNNIANAKSQEEWDNTVDDIKKIGGYVGDFIDWYDSLG